MIKRFFLRWRWMHAYEQSLNRRAEVEQHLLDCANGKCPLPDTADCRELAHRLSVPNEWKSKPVKDQ